MVAIPELEQGLFTAVTFRVKAMKPWSPQSAYAHLAELGRWTEYSREELQKHAGRVPFELWLQGMFSDEGILCEAFIDERWQAASWWRIQQLEYVMSLVMAARQIATEQLERNNTFRREGETWSLCYEGRRVGMHHRRGLEYVAQLLARPNAPIDVIELVSLVEKNTLQTNAPTPMDQLTSARGSPDPIADSQAIAEYRRRIADLQSDEAEAARQNDFERSSRAREERERIEDHLRNSFALGGRLRAFGTDDERARVNVTKQIAGALKKIREHHATLGAHLRNSIRTGRACCYSPETPITWDL